VEIAKLGAEKALVVVGELLERAAAAFRCVEIKSSLGRRCRQLRDIVVIAGQRVYWHLKGTCSVKDVHSKFTS